MFVTLTLFPRASLRLSRGYVFCCLWSGRRAGAGGWGVGGGGWGDGGGALNGCAGERLGIVSAGCASVRRLLGVGMTLGMGLRVCVNGRLCPSLPVWRFLTLWPVVDGALPGCGCFVVFPACPFCVRWPGVEWVVAPAHTLPRTSPLARQRVLLSAPPAAGGDGGGLVGRPGGCCRRFATAPRCRTKSSTRRATRA